MIFTFLNICKNRNIYWHTAMLTHLRIAHGCFYSTAAELSSCNRDHMTGLTYLQTLCHALLYRIPLPVPSIPLQSIYNQFSLPTHSQDQSLLYIYFFLKNLRLQNFAEPKFSKLYSVPLKVVCPYSFLPITTSFITSSVYFY